MNMSETQRLRKENAQQYKRVVELEAMGTSESARLSQMLITERARTVELEAENERLRCCGSCCLWRPEPDADDSYVCKALDVTFGPPLPGDPCHFDPSRYQPRKGGDDR